LTQKNPYILVASDIGTGKTGSYFLLHDRDSILLSFINVIAPTQNRVHIGWILCSWNQDAKKCLEKLANVSHSQTCCCC